MQVSAKEIAKAFRDLIGGACSREEIATWASRVRANEDGDGIEYLPESAETDIWEALEFLMGVDLKDSPNSYLHNTADIEEYWITKKAALEAY